MCMPKWASFDQITNVLIYLCIFGINMLRWTRVEFFGFERRSSWMWYIVQLIRFFEHWSSDQLYWVLVELRIKLKNHDSQSQALINDIAVFVYISISQLMCGVNCDHLIYACVENYSFDKWCSSLVYFISGWRSIPKQWWWGTIWYSWQTHLFCHWIVRIR